VVGDGTIRKSVVTIIRSSRPSILHSNLSSIFTRFRDRPIAAFVLHHAAFPTHLSLHKISPCSPGHRQSRSVHFGGKTFCPKIHTCKVARILHDN